MQTRVLIILILAGLLCGFIINMGAPAFAFVWAGLRVEKIVWTPNTGFTLYVDCNYYAISKNVSQIWVNCASVSVTSPKLPCTIENEYLTFVVAFAYTNGTSYDISVVLLAPDWSNGWPITKTFQGGTNWEAPSSSLNYSSLYLPLLIVIVAPMATFVGPFVLKKKLAISKHMKVVKTVALTFMVVQLANLPIEYSLTHEYSWFYMNYVYLYELSGFLEGISLLAFFSLLSMLGMCIAIYLSIGSEDGKRTFIAGPLSIDMRAVLYTSIVVQLANFLIELWLLTSLPLIFA